jgi:hypothetical protein
MSRRTLSLAALLVVGSACTEESKGTRATLAPSATSSDAATPSTVAVCDDPVRAPATSPPSSSAASVEPPAVTGSSQSSSGGASGGVPVATGPAGSPGIGGNPPGAVPANAGGGASGAAPSDANQDAGSPIADVDESPRPVVTAPARRRSDEARRGSGRTHTPKSARRRAAVRAARSVRHNGRTRSTAS